MRYIATKPNQKQLIHYIENDPYEYQMATHPTIPATKITPAQDELTQLETYDIIRADKKDLINAATEAIHIILTGITNDIYSTVDACPNVKEMLKAIKMKGDNINKQDVETKLFWEFGKFTLTDGETVES
ncbi:hypothetical protein Tco_0374104 [Tanacetum coccineum]